MAAYLEHEPMRTVPMSSPTVVDKSEPSKFSEKQHNSTSRPLSGVHKAARKTARTIFGVLSKVGHMVGNAVTQLSGSKRKKDSGCNEVKNRRDDDDLQKAIAASLKGSSQWVCSQCTFVCEDSDEYCKACCNGRGESSTFAEYGNEVEGPLDLRDEQGLQLPVINNGGSLFRLNAVIRHLGQDTLSGHYIADVRCEKGWQRCDDSLVVDMSEQQVVNEKENAYILFYVRE